MINHNGKNMEKNVCVTELLFWTAEISTLKINYTLIFFLKICGEKDNKTILLLMNIIEIKNRSEKLSKRWGTCHRQ